MKFHLAFPVTDLERTHEFYTRVLGCPVGRTSERWIDFDFFGHQITAHLVDHWSGRVNANPVDQKEVPIPHFGVILNYVEFDQLAARLQSAAVNFIIEPYLRFAGRVGEQKTMFVQDPSGNGIEFKAFADEASVFLS